VLERHGYRAGKHTVGYQSCDVSTAETGGFEFRKCAANANSYAHARRLVAVIGTYSSFCAEVEIPILNRAPGGPIAMISPSNTGPSLTRGGPLAIKRGEPGIYYPTGVRNFMRVAPREDLQGAAQAVLADQLGLDRVAVLVERDPDWRQTWADPFRRAARERGVQTELFAYDADAPSFGPLAERVANAGADGVFVLGSIDEGGDQLVRALRSKAGDDVTIHVLDLFGPVPYVLEKLGPAAHGIYMSATDTPPHAIDLSPEGERFVRDFGYLDNPTPYVLPAAQAAESVLEAIARSDGTRRSVLARLRATKVEDGILGSFRLDPFGDIDPGRIPIFRITGSKTPGEPVYEIFEGAVVDRVITVPSS
jgi:branched-chain amino acid transport system substrate-binding protein